MDAEDKKALEAQGLNLVRAFLSLPPDKRAKALAFVDALLRPGENAQASADRTASVGED